MLSIFLDFLIFLQAAGTAPGGGGGGGGEAAGPGGMSCAMNAGLFGVMMIVFYFFLLRPEKKKREEHEELLRSIRKGTEVRTTGGILGKVVNADDPDELVLEIADKTRIHVLRANIATLEDVRKAEAQKAASANKGKTTKKKSDEDDEDAARADS